MVKNVMHLNPKRAFLSPLLKILLDPAEKFPIAPSDSLSKRDRNEQEAA
jgi:hypothetical protein